MQFVNHQSTLSRCGTFIFLLFIFFTINGSDFFGHVNKNSIEDYAANMVREGSMARRIGLLCLGGFGLANILKKRSAGTRINGILGWLLILFMFWALLSLSWAQDIPLTSRRLLVLIMLCLGAISFNRSVSLHDFVLFVFFSTTMFLIVGLASEIIFCTFQPMGNDYRFSGGMHPNQQGINCTLLLFSGITIYLNAERYRALYAIFAIIGLFFLFLTRSRTGLFSATIALFLFYAIVWSIQQKCAFFLFTGSMICLLMLIFDESFFSALRTGFLLGRDGVQATSLTGRIPAWNECFSYVSAHPFLGFGYNSFWTPNHIAEISSSQGWEISSGHSAYLDVLLCQGIIGLLGYLFIFVMGTIRAFHRYKATKNTFYLFSSMLLVFCLFDSLLESAIFNPTLFSFITIAVLVQLAFFKPHMEINQL
jgi:exopolysaccharide production protein ExoQ